MLLAHTVMNKINSRNNLNETIPVISVEGISPTSLIALFWDGVKISEFCIISAASGTFNSVVLFQMKMYALIVRFQHIGVWSLIIFTFLPICLLFVNNAVFQCLYDCSPLNLVHRQWIMIQI